jgi:CRISPR system Cascade subunit CasC
MKYLSIHLLRSLPASCVNRDDINEPKRAIFGGVPRLRVSSQCFGHWLRKGLKENEALKAHFQGIRTRKVAGLLEGALREKGSGDEAKELAAAAVEALGKKDSKNAENLAAISFLSPSEISEVATAIIAKREELKDEFYGKKKKGKKAKAEENEDAEENEEGVLSAKAKTAIQNAVKGAKREDAIDIALFGRMMASAPDLAVESLTQRNHWLTTHEASAQDDFYSAVEELGGTDPDSAMIDTVQFGSGTFYGYITVDLDGLKQELKDLKEEDKAKILEELVKAIVTTTPKAKGNSMNAETPLEYAIAIVGKGSPIQLINAFETPVPAGPHGYSEASVQALEAELAQGIEQEFIEASEILRTGMAKREGLMPLNAFCKRVAAAALK